MRLRTLTLLVTLAAGTLSACVPLVIGGVAAGGVMVAQDRSIGTGIDDTVIRTRITNRFLQNDVNDLMTGVGVEVKEGSVILTGSVKSQDTATEAVKLCWQVSGVREVVNEIQVIDHTTVQDVTKDSWITTQVRTRLIAEKGVKSINYTVETVNAIVYLMGIAQDQKELDRATNVASRVVGVKQVVSHVRLKDDPRIADKVN